MVDELSQNLVALKQLKLLLWIMPLVYQPQLLTWFRSLCSPLPQWGFRRRLLFRGHDPTAKHMHQNMLRKNKEKYTEYTVANSLRPSDAYLCVNKPTHYLSQCWNIVNWTLRKKFLWYVNRNSYTTYKENAFENDVYKTWTILPRPQYVNSLAQEMWL